MKLQSITFAALLFSPVAIAEIPSELKFSFLHNQPSFDCSLVPAPEASSESGFSTADKSPLFEVAAAERTKNGFKGGVVSIYLEFDEEGFVKEIRIHKTSRNLSVDMATRNWARCTRTVPGKLTNAVLPVSY